MRLGRLNVHLLSDGMIKRDGGMVFGMVPKVIWEQRVRPDRRNRIRLGINCVLIQAPEGNILIDTGVGTKYDDEQKEMHGIGNSKLLRELRDRDLSAKDIDTVVLTNLHFDRAGGSTKLNRKGEVVPTYPKARYLAQRAAWEDAVHPNERSKHAYHSKDFLPLLQREQVDFLDGDHQLVNGVWLKVTHGYCRGQQIALISQGSTKVAFLGDLVPTAYHLGLPYISAADQYPEDTLERKRELLSLAEREGWLILFCNGYDYKAGYLQRKEGRMALRPVEL